MESAERKAYSLAVLSVSQSESIVFAPPLSFGKVNVKDRIKRVMDRKMPVWALCLAAIICASLLALMACAPDAANIGDTSHADLESSKIDNSDESTDPIIITVAYGEPEDGYFIFEDSESAGLETVKISTNKEVKNFKFISVLMDENTAPATGNTLYESNTLAPSKPFFARTHINEGWSERGFSFENSNGETEYYRIIFSSLNGELSTEVISGPTSKTP